MSSSYRNDFPHSINKRWNLFILYIFENKYLNTFYFYPFATTTYGVLQVSSKLFYCLGMNPTVRKIDNTDTMINSIMAIIHRRPVGIDKITDIAVAGPAVAHYNWSFSYVFFNERLEVWHTLAATKPERHTKPSARVFLNTTERLHMISRYVPSNVVFSCIGKVGFVYFNDHTYSLNILMVFDGVFTNLKVLNHI